MRRWSILFLVAATLGVVACREGVEPFVPEVLEPFTGDTYQLTYNKARDFSPTWSSNSDTVFYSTSHFTDYATIAGTLLRLPREGGTATLLAQEAQTGRIANLMSPAVSPDGDRIAYIHIPFMMSPALCPLPEPLPPRGSIPPQRCDMDEPLLEEGFVRVRRIHATTRATSDHHVAIPFQGVDPARAAGGAEEYLQRALPFQSAFRLRGEVLVRPSWAPDGQRVVFSDGLTLRVWNTAETHSTPIPNTADGVSAAWSPDGGTIAFTRMTRTDSTLISCTGCSGPGGTGNMGPTHHRWIYAVPARVITLVRPDGGGVIEIAEGEDPAWSPDGGTIYFSNNDRIYRIPAAGGTPMEVPGTAGGRSPAPSPDGQWLAFTRATPKLDNNDIWITRLGAQQGSSTVAF